MSIFGGSQRLPAPTPAPDPAETAKKEEEKLAKANAIRERSLRAANSLDNQFKVRKTGLKI